MASAEHKLLANNIKRVHKHLREKVLSGETVENVWKNHVENIEVLEDYAKSMEELATKHWLNQEHSRIDWIYKQIEEYFWLEGAEKEHARDLKLAKRRNESVQSIENVKKIEKLKVLDVGSCYNPFVVFDRLDVLPIDIAPANSQVYNCDFLQVDISKETVTDQRNVKSLTKESFNVIIFCLLLEYLPSSYQRWQCVSKAVRLLCEGGLLCIVTPDSSHMGKNCQQLKSWRQGLGVLGLGKVCYEKTKHFHGLVYRKPGKLVQSIISEQTIEKVTCDKEDLFYIPQDFSTKIVEVSEEVELTEEDRELIKESFTELPGFSL